MRRMIMSMLLASSIAMPAMAQDGGFARRDRLSDEQRSEARAARADGAQRAERVEQTERGERFERVERTERAERPQRAERAARPQLPDRATWSEGGEQRQQRMDQQSERRPMIARRDGEQRDEGRRREAAPMVVQQQVIQQRADDYAPSRRGSTGDQIRNRWSGQPGVTVVHRDGDGHSRSTHNWSSQWRNDRNYNWRHHRDRNHWLFRQGNYWDPYQTGYRRFSIGFSMWPNYYQSNYWLDDPWMYRLPPAYGPYRWVRYYDDALLVNIYTGQVVDVVYSFFW